MNINTITTDDLRGMEGKDGLILQGCGGWNCISCNSINPFYWQYGNGSGTSGKTKQLRSIVEKFNK